MTVVNFDIINCPYCKKENEIPLYHTVNVDVDPDLRRKILDDSLNTFVCRECLFKCELNFDFLYHDMKNKFVLYFSTDQKVIDDQISYYENYEDDLIKITDSMNYFRKLVGVTNWEDLKETIRENERLSGLMEFEKRDLKNFFDKNSVEFYNYVSRKKSLRRHSELKYFIDNIIEQSGLEKQIREKINKVKKKLRVEIPEFENSLIISEAETERFRDITNNNIMTVENNIIIPPDKNEFGIELINIKSLNFINHYRKYTEEEIYEFCKYRALGVSRFVVSQGPEKHKEVLYLIQYPDSENFNEGNVILSQSIYDKWDIKIDEDKIHFLNSHTGENIFRANILRRKEEGKIILSYIDVNSGYINFIPEFSILFVDFLIKVYIMKVQAPFPIPKNIEKNIKHIIYYACIYFMEKAEYGSYENTLTEYFENDAFH